MSRPKLWLDEFAFDVEIDSAWNLRAVSKWYDTPDEKFTATARVHGDGDYEPRDSDVLYAARTVSFTLVSLNDTREDATRAMTRLGLLHHKQVVVRLVDGAYDTFSYGTVTFAFPATYSNNFEFTATVVCRNPTRWSTAAKTYQLTSSAGTGGFEYVVQYPVKYREPAPAQNVAVLANDGTTTAYPVVTVEGDMPDGFTLFLDGNEVTYTGGVYLGAPVVIDYLTETATQGGAPRSNLFLSRQFSGVPKESTSSLMLSPRSATNTAWANVELHDTYL